MNRIFFHFLVLLILFSCGRKVAFKPRNFNKVEIKNILEDSTLSIRAIELLNDGSLAFAANKGTYGLYNPLKDQLITSQLEYDSLNLEFRAIAHTASDFFMLSVANPALLFKTGENGKMELVYKEANDKVFYDAMCFWNDLEGIAVGDPTNDCMSIIITRDGGKTWKKMECNQIPKAVKGEAAFAASNTNIAISGNKTWVATGGKVSRILYSPDKGKTWKFINTPFIQGLETTGMYSIDFYNEHIGFAIGGDYTKPKATISNKTRTTDGGKTWSIVGNHQMPSYRSCVQFIPGRDGKELVVIGFQGIDFSNNTGDTWEHISNEGYYTLRFLNDSIAYAAGAGKISRLTFKE